MFTVVDVALDLLLILGSKIIDCICLEIHRPIIRPKFLKLPNYSFDPKEISLGPDSSVNA